MVYLASTSAAAAVKLGEARSWSINVDHETDEDNALGDTWKSATGGLLGASINVEFNFDTAASTPFDAATADGPVKFYLYPIATTSGRNYAGTVWAKMTAEAGLGGTGSGTLSGEVDGTLVQN